MIAAANVPSFWREVIGNSKEIWRSLIRYPFEDGNSLVNRNANKRLASEAFGYDTQKVWTFKYTLTNGILFVHRNTDGAEGFIFAPISEKLPLRVIEPDTKMVNYNMNRRFGYGYIDLRDFEGSLVCSKRISDNVKDVMWRYLRALHGNPEEEKSDSQRRPKNETRQRGKGRVI